MRLWILLAILTTGQAFGLVLEDLEDLETTLHAKTVGYFVGSFDPLHKAHEAIVEEALKANLCDMVLIHPVWGKDGYKVRTHIDTRLDMLFSVYKNHPKVIVSRLTPLELQNSLTAPSSETHMAPKFCTFVGIVGADTALYLAPNPDTAKVYMTGLKIGPEHAEHTWGSCMALPVQRFIVALRQASDITALNGSIQGRPIAAMINIQESASYSSTKIKIALKRGEGIEQFVSPSIHDFILKHSLY